MAVDRRLLSKDGRAEIVQEQKDLPQNAEIIGKMTAAGVTSLGVATASLASGDQNLKKAYDTVMSPAKTFSFVQKHPEAATVIEQFKQGDYEGILRTKDSLNLLAKALGQDANILLTSFTQFINNTAGIYNPNNNEIYLDVGQKNRSDIVKTTGHELAHSQGIKNETGAELSGWATDLAFGAGVSYNKDRIEAIKPQIGDGRDEETRKQNIEVLKKDNTALIEAYDKDAKDLEERTSLIQDKETTAKLYGCAKQWSISFGINTLNYHKKLSSVQDQAYVKGYENAIDKAVADVKNKPESVQGAYKLLKEDPKAFGSAMLQALKDLPAEYKDKLDKVTNAKLRATTPAELAAAGKAEAELRIEFAGVGVGGAGIGKTGLKVVEKTTKAINDLKKAEEIKKAESIAKRKQEIDNNFNRDDELWSNKPSGKQEHDSKTEANINAMKIIVVKQLDGKFKHAEDFGISTTKKNPETLKQFESAIKDSYE